VKVFPAPAQKVVMAPKTWQIFWNTNLEMAIKFNYSYKFGIKTLKKTLVLRKKMLNHDQLELGIKK
jgi:hypothetical protein